jgi:serine/threonine protein kinase/TolB-like protein/Flp pilus assembly protein TadD
VDRDPVASESIRTTPALPLRPDSTLAHYRILRQLGQGAQATAYLAEDRRLHRHVVLKTLRPDAAGDADRRRFEREALLCSALDNPNVCPVYDVGDADGIAYITMQYVEGQTLRELLAKGPLAPMSALSIAIQVADGLAVAHAAGIVHRDVKPGNVIVAASGQAKILDFGLAKLLSPAPASGQEEPLTDVGVPVGTMGYGSPEMASGEPSDHRSDVFSVGVVLFEMLTGRRPFQGRHAVEILHAVINQPAPPLSRFLGDCPPELQAILNRALAKRARDRYQTMAALRDDLKVLMRRLSSESGVVPTESSATLLPPQTLRPRWFSQGPIGRVLGRLRAGARAARARPADEPAPPVAMPPESAPVRPFAWGTEVKKTLAVLPFRNLSGDTELDAFGPVLLDALVVALSGVGSVVVRPSAYVQRYAQGAPDPQRVADELAVGWLLTGSFVRNGDTLRTSLELLAPMSGELLWADRVDAPVEDRLQAQDLIAERVVSGLELHLAPETESEADAEEARTTNAEAYGFYLRGREMLGHFVQRSFDVEELDLAIRLFNEAVGLDPEFASAHASLGRAYLLHAQGYGGPEYVRLAERSLRRALEVEPGLLKARTQLVYVHLHDGDRRSVRAAIEELQREAPDYPGTLELVAHVARLQGRHDDALAAYDRLGALRPDDAAAVSLKRARVLLAQGKRDEALAAIDHARELARNHALVQGVTALVWMHTGRLERATTLLRRVLERYPDLIGLRPWLACCQALRGHRSQAEALLAGRVSEAGHADPDAAFGLAAANALLGNHATALDWLKGAANLGYLDRVLLAASPHLEALRATPAYEAWSREVESDASLSA